MKKQQKQEGQEIDYKIFNQDPAVTFSSDMLRKGNQKYDEGMTLNEI